MQANEEVMAFFTYLQSQSSTQRYLYNCYRHLEIDDAERKSYENCNTFMYCLDHGIQYYKAGEKLDMLIKPVMLFYGMTHLLKASLLTCRPEYPESTTVLAHGVSTRKRKRKNYSFLEDEVKVQHHGLFPYFSEHLFDLKPLSFEKISMMSLLRLIPELNTFFHFGNKRNLIPIGNHEGIRLEIPKQLCDDYHLTEKALLNRLTPFLPDVKKSDSNTEMIMLNLEEPIKGEAGPFRIAMDKTIYLPTKRELFFPISEIMIHYLLLYNLSMLSRYEAEWWGELITTKPDLDFPFISRFLMITQEKIPYLIGKLLSKHNSGGG